MFRIFAIITAGLMAMVPAHAGAVTIHVPADYTNIQDAINVSVSGDTVLVAPGRYAVNLNFFGKNIVLTSEAGPELTFIDPQTSGSSTIRIVNYESSSAVVDGFTFGVNSYTNRAVEIYGASPIIRNNIFRRHIGEDGGSPVLFAGSGSDALIANNIFYDNTGPGMNVWIEMAGNVKFVNNTVYGGAEGIMAASTTTVVRNNIITGCQIGLYSPSGWTAIEDYNDVWGNAVNYSAISPSPADISGNPVFMDTLTRNFQLRRASPCIDAGNPSGIYNDPDGTRNDMGALPFDQRIPSAFNLNPGSEDIAHVLNHTPVFHWLFYDTVYMTQAGYEIEVGTDKDWTTAEMWQSGQILSGDSSAVYSGTPLQNGVTYYYRIRVSGDGTAWGSWKEAAFTMNAAPEAPFPDWPVGIQVSIDGVHLLVDNSVDLNGDPLIYDFEIYSDAGLGTLADSIYGVKEQKDKTNSGFFSGLTVGHHYWWRCRAQDEYQPGDWCGAQEFTVRNPLTVHIPSDYSTLQAGINAAQESDTVLAAASTYTGDGNRDLTFNGKNIVLKSESGPEATIIDCEAGPMNAHWGIYLHDSEDTSAVIDGFTVKNSFADELGAIYLVGASPTIRNCIITQNDGLGIEAVSGARPIIDSCIISNNSGNGINGGYYQWGGVIISNSLIKENGGCGIWLNIYPLSTVTNCTVIGNGSSGIHLEGEPPKAQASFADSTIIAECLVAYNKRGFEKGCCWYPSCAIRCNDVFGNDSGNFVYLSEHGGDSAGNLELNPLFCNYSAGDYHISSSSPCAPAHNSCGRLMGAFGVNCALICGDVDNSGAINLLDIVYLIRYLYKGGPPPTAPHMADVDHSGGVNLLDISYLINSLYKQGPPPNCP